MVGVRLFVGNLPYAISERELRELLGRIGAVTSVSMPTDRLTGRPRGFAFVDVPSESDAREMIRQFDGSLLDNRRLRVRHAEEREVVHAPAKYRYHYAPKGRPDVRPHRPERSPGR